CTAGSGGTGGSFAAAPFSGTGGAGGTGGTSAGGAAYIQGQLFMTNCLFYQNTAAAGSTAAAEVDSGGSSHNGGAGGEASGGGLYVVGGALRAYLENTIFFDNSCIGGAGGGSSQAGTSGGSGGSALGGGLASGASLTQLRNCTLATNTVAGGAAGENGGGVGGTAGWDAYRSGGTFKVFGSILSGVTNAPNVSGLTDIGYNISSDASLARSTSTTLLHTDPVLDSGLSAVGPAIGGPFGSPMLTLALLSGSPGEAVIPGLPGFTFPATDEILNLRGTPASVGAYELDPLAISTNAGPPTISAAPTDQSAHVGDAVQFMVTAETNGNSSNPLGYQWQLNGVNLTESAAFIGATSNILTISKVTASDAGTYTVVVGSSVLEGSVTNSAILTVTAAIIKTQPVSKLNQIAGSVVTFHVAAIPGTFSYQWYFDDGAGAGSNPISEGGEYSGTTASTLTINPVEVGDVGSYTVLVTGANGSSLSAAARLGKLIPDVKPPGVVITSPAANARTANPIFNGTVSDNTQAASVMYWITNLNDGSVTSGYASLSPTGTTTKTWAFSATVTPGTNVLAVQAMDNAGNNSPLVTRRFFYEAAAAVSLSSAGNGAGALSGLANNALLIIGQGYSVVAQPDKYSLFNYWTVMSGGAQQTVSSPTLHFIMESNTVLVANFATNIFLETAGVYNGLFFVDNDVEFETAGMLANLVVGAKGAYSGKLILAGTNYSLSGVFDPSGHASIAFRQTKSFGTRLQIALFLAPGSTQITGTLNINSALATLQADRAAPSAGASRYTLLMLPPANFPVGDGYALILDRNGVVTLNGGLADGAGFTQTVPASLAGDVPIFANLYDNTGLLLGWLNLANLDNSAGGLAWIKKGARGSLLFTNGFTNMLQIQGSPWTPPASPLSFSTLDLSSAGLNLEFPISVTSHSTLVKTPGAPPNSLTGTIQPQTGLLQITFGNGNGKATTTGWGAVLQNVNMGGGYFVVGADAGLIILQP
ncbi:MAG TPA: immunoglobulin domain-containing protein, partial [Candidatus Saccharimonadales bacterium]|nr:immunoglobulin domain-containing protein [Candidatus Saccharimonadales bacterium]